MWLFGQFNTYSLKPFSLPVSIFAPFYINQPLPSHQTSLLPTGLQTSHLPYLECSSPTWATSSSNVHCGGAIGHCLAQQTEPLKVNSAAHPNYIKALLLCFFLLKLFAGGHERAHFLTMYRNMPYCVRPVVYLL